MQYTNLKESYASAKAAEQSYTDNKDSIVSSGADSLINSKSERLGYQNMRLQSMAMVAEVFNREAASGRYPEHIRNNGLSLSLIYAPNCSVKELAKRAAATAETDYQDRLKRLQGDTVAARNAIATALEAIELQNAEQQRQQQEQNELKQMLEQA